MADPFTLPMDTSKDAHPFWRYYMGDAGSYASGYDDALAKYYNNNPELKPDLLDLAHMGDKYKRENENMSDKNKSLDGKTVYDQLFGDEWKWGWTKPSDWVYEKSSVEVDPSSSTVEVVDSEHSRMLNDFVKRWRDLYKDRKLPWVLPSNKETTPWLEEQTEVDPNYKPSLYEEIVGTGSYFDNNAVNKQYNDLTNVVVTARYPWNETANSYVVVPTVFSNTPVKENVTNKVEYTFNEDTYVKEALDHITKTYSQHYSGAKYQATDIIIDSGHGTGFNVGNAMKYLKRYGKKEGYNRKDLLKAIHYIIIQLYVHDLEQLDNVKETE